MRTAAAATALGITLTLAGLASCAGPGEPVAPPGPDPSVTPVFASEEEALAAAEELYGRYYEFSNALGASGWRKIEGIENLVAGDALEDELKTAELFASKGYRQVGRSTFDTLTLQQVVDLGRGTVEITFYACGDVTDVDVLNEKGVSVVSEARPNRQPVEVELADADGTLKIVRRDSWSGSSFC